MNQIRTLCIPGVQHQNHPVVFRSIAAGDIPFLFQLYASTREDVVGLPWTPEQKHAFLVQQFNAQHTHYQQHYAGADFLILQSRGVDFGRMYLHRTPKEHRLMEITLLPEHRNQGFGTHLMEVLIQQAQEADLPLTLHVETFNPAYQLYRKLGFQDVRVHGLYMFMEKLPL